MAEKEKKTPASEGKVESKVDSSIPQKTVSGISGTKTLRVGRVNKKAKKPPVEEAAAPEKEAVKESAAAKAAPATRSRSTAARSSPPAARKRPASAPAKTAP